MFSRSSSHLWYSTSLAVMTDPETHTCHLKPVRLLSEITRVFWLF